jgi:DNA-directed RNA polymerase specialized sigma24 family protein
MISPLSPRQYCVSSYKKHSERRILKCLPERFSRGPTHRRGTWATVQPIADNPLMSIEAADVELIALLDRVASHDHAALKALYDRCSSKLFGLAVRVVSNREWAEDVLQEAFLNIWRSAADYRASLSPPMAWMGPDRAQPGAGLFAPPAAERDTRHAGAGRGDGGHTGRQHPQPDGHGPSQRTGVGLHQCLGQLENRQREVVSLAYIRDLSHSELSDTAQAAAGHRQDLDPARAGPTAPCMARFA